MWRWLSRETDLLKLVNETNSVKDLISLKKYLLDESNTMILRDSHVYEALNAIKKKMATKDEIIQEILDLLF